MKKVYTRISIMSSPEKVWAVLSDFARYSNWNPFITQITGDLHEGAMLQITIDPPESRKAVFKPTLVKLEPNRELVWTGKLIIPGLLDGKHSFRIEHVAGNRVRFIHKEMFSGLLVQFMSSKYLKNIKKGFEQMNESLKKRVEQT